MSTKSPHFQRNRQWLRWLGHIWASPNTLLGIILGLAGSAQWQIHGTTIEILLKNGPVHWCCRRLQISAFTLGDTVLYTSPPCHNLRIHEGRHSMQYWVLGPFFLPVYYILLGLRGYWNHPLEIDARQWEFEHCGCLYGSQLMPKPPRQSPTDAPHPDAQPPAPTD